MSTEVAEGMCVFGANAGKEDLDGEGNGGGTMEVRNLRLTLEVFLYAIAGYQGKAGGMNKGGLSIGAWIANAIPLAVWL